MISKGKNYFHALTIDTSRCTGCTKCVRICPTEALRVRDGKVILDEHRCIDCGECIRTCPYNAIQAKADSFCSIAEKKYKIGILSTAYAGQFPSTIGYETAKKALLHIGFDEVVEESTVTPIMGNMIRDYLDKHPHVRPILSSHCPAVVRLIQVRFPSLLPTVFHQEAPMSLLAMYLQKKISAEKHISSKDIGIYLIVPCIAQVTAVHQPEGTYRHLHDGAIAIREIYREVMGKLKVAQEDHQKMDIHVSGLTWAISGLAAQEISDHKIKVLAVNGIHNVIKILSRIENQQLEPFDFVVLNSCINGCVGGVLNVENPFIASSRIMELLQHADDDDSDKDAEEYFWHQYKKNTFAVKALESRSIMELDGDIKKALLKMKKIQEIYETLPGLDCSACGSPSCHTLAEDIVAGTARVEDCVVLLRKKMKQ